jgi:peptide/nickel transport system substrate-binding protein
VPTFVTGTVWEHVDFGINPVESYDRPDFFEDVRTRQAIAMCLDTQSVIDAILFGRSIKISNYIPPEHPLYNPDIKVWDYDPEAAMALLEEVGWVDTDGDGIREAQGVEGIADGTKMAFKWQSTTADMRIAYMQIYQQNLIECGIDLTIENLPAGEYFADGPEGPLFGRHFDLGSFAWLTGVDPPCNLYLGSQWPSEESGWAGQNDPGFINEEFDAACNAALQSLPGTPEYEQYHKEAQRIFAEQLPVVPLFLRLKLAAYAPYVTGFIMDPTENSEMWNIEMFDIEG